MATNYGTSPIVSDGLVYVLDAANIKMYPGSGTTVTDTISDTSGTFTGAGFYDTSTFATPVFSFDGSNDYLTYTDSTIPTLGSALTCGLWIKSSDSQAELFCTFETANPYKGFLFGIGFSGNNGKLDLYCSPTDGSGGSAAADTGVAVNDNTIKYVVVTYDGSNARFYHDGVLSSTVSFTKTAGASTQPFRIGASNNSPANRIYSGLMGPGHIYNRTLTDAEVLQNYNAMAGRFS